MSCKNIYSLPALREQPEAANRHYLEFVSAIGDPGDETLLRSIVTI